MLRIMMNRKEPLWLQSVLNENGKNREKIVNNHVNGTKLNRFLVNCGSFCKKDTNQ